MCLVIWRNSMNGPPIVSGGMPKVPTVWFGEIYLVMPSGEKDTRQWRSNGKITRKDAQAVLEKLLDMLIGEHGKESAVDSGFTIRSR